MATELNGWAQVTRKGQVTIPKPIRALVGISDGGKVRFHLCYDGTVVMESNKSHKDLSGRLNNYADSENPVDAYSSGRKWLMTGQKIWVIDANRILRQLLHDVPDQALQVDKYCKKPKMAIKLYGDWAIDEAHIHHDFDQGLRCCNFNVSSFILHKERYVIDVL